MLVDLRARLDDVDVRSLLAVLAWTGTSEHLDRICNRYRQRNGRVLLGLEAEGTLTGCIGVQPFPAGRAIIRHIAVDAACRKRGVGRSMVNYVQETYGARALVAETDSEAVGFYKRCGFQVEFLGETFTGTERFWCTLGEPARDLIEQVG